MAEAVVVGVVTRTGSAVAVALSGPADTPRFRARREFGLTRPGLDHDGLNRHTMAWVDAVNGSGAALVTASLLDGVWSVRVSIGAENTERSDVEHLWRLLQHAAATAEAG